MAPGPAPVETRRRVGTVTVHLPASLTPLFRDVPRQLDLAAATVLELIEALDARWPGMRDRLIEAGPRLRVHLNVFIDGERAKLHSSLDGASTVHILTAVSGG